MSGYAMKVNGMPVTVNICNIHLTVLKLQFLYCATFLLQMTKALR